MARGSNKRDGRAARSELPSGVEATNEDIGEFLLDGGRDRFKANFDKDSGFTSIGKVNFGDGVEGNGIIKNGVFSLRDEDIERIVIEAFGDDGDDTALKTIIGDGGGTQPLALFVGKNNIVDADSSPEAAEFSKKSAFAFNNEMRNSPIELPDATNYEVVDFEAGERQTRDDPGYDASGSLDIGRADISFTHLQAAYEKVTGLPVDRKSMVRLANALDERANKVAESVEERLSENFDWEDYGSDGNRDYEEDYD